jgi:sugar phosphate isomerase/epimerase
LIFISSSCVKCSSIRDSIKVLASSGIQQIELSGGTNFYTNLISDVLDLAEQYELSYQLHNYFPPPKKHFVLNLASCEKEIWEKSVKHCEEALRLSKLLGGSKYGVHAGFLVDVDVNQLGQKISRKTLNKRENALARFAEAWDRLNDVSAQCGVNLYLENNVLSRSNFEAFDGENPFLLTDVESYQELKSIMSFEFLLDLAHLKVSATTLGLGFGHELEFLLPRASYLHLSENDGLADQNKALKMDSGIMAFLTPNKLKGKTITLETYCELSEILESRRIVQQRLVA